MKNPVLRHSFEFSVQIHNFCRQLKSERQYELAGQLFRSGTSIGANIWEAQEAESKADFIHKMKISAKEAQETQYWLLLCQSVHQHNNPQLLLEKLQEIRKLISAIIYTSKNRL